MKTMVQSLNAEIKFDSSFMPFLMNVSKTGFTAISIETAVHRADCSALCGRYRFSRIFNIIYFHSNTMKPVIMFTGFIIGYGLLDSYIYISNNPIIFVSINHFRRITHAFNCRRILREIFRGNIDNNSNSNTNT